MSHSGILIQSQAIKCQSRKQWREEKRNSLYKHIGNCPVFLFICLFYFILFCFFREDFIIVTIFPFVWWSHVYKVKYVRNKLFNYSDVNASATSANQVIGLSKTDQQAGAFICLVVAITTDAPAFVEELQMRPPCKPEQSYRGWGRRSGLALELVRPPVQIEVGYLWTGKALKGHLHLSARWRGDLPCRGAGLFHPRYESCRPRS